MYLEAEDQKRIENVCFVLRHVFSLAGGNVVVEVATQCPAAKSVYRLHRATTICTQTVEIGQHRAYYKSEEIIE